MASLRVLAFDHEGRPVQFDTWLEDLQLYLLSDSKDSVSLFDLASGAATAPPATADSSTRSHTLSASTTVEDLVPHLRASDARYRAAIHADFLDRNLPPVYITLYFIVTRLPESRCSLTDHFLSLDPTSLTVDLLEQHLLAAETSAVAVGAARGTPRPPFFEGCSPSHLAPSYAYAAAAEVSVPEDVGAASASAKRRSTKGKGGRGGGGGSGGGGGGSGSGGGGSSGGGGGGGSGGGSGGSGGGSSGSGGSGGGRTGGSGTGARRVSSVGGQRQQQQRRSETLSPQQIREWFLRGPSGGSCPYVIHTGDRAGQNSERLHTQHRCFSRLEDAWCAEFGDDVELLRWADLLKSRIAIFDLVLMLFSLLCIAATALGASESGTLPRTAPAQALHTFTLDSGTSRCFFNDNTTLTPLPAPVPVRLADPSGGLDAMVTTTTPCAGGAGVGDPGVGGARAGGAGPIDPGSAMRPRLYFIPLLQQVLGTPRSAALTPPLLCPRLDQSQPPLQMASPLPAPSPYNEQSGSLTERREPASHLVLPVRTARRVPRSRPPPAPGMHAMTLRPSSVPLRVPLPAPPESSLPKVPDPESDRARAASPTVSRLLATAVTDPSVESAAASALVAELLDFPAA
ncbi:unnamed protein product [Closterium sp. NIES-53]